MQFDHTLQEICKTSAMKAASAMSKLLKTPLKIDVKPVKVEKVQNMDLPNHMDETTVGLFVPIDSLVKGGSLFLTSKKSALAICDLMLSRRDGYSHEITEVEESALRELANIVLGNFLTPFAHSLLIASLMHRPATYEYDKSSVIIKNSRSKLLTIMGENSVLNITFSYEHDNVKGDIYIVLEERKINTLLRTMMALTNG